MKTLSPKFIFLWVPRADTKSKIINQSYTLLPLKSLKILNIYIAEYVTKHKHLNKLVSRLSVQFGLTSIKAPDQILPLDTSNKKWDFLLLNCIASSIPTPIHIRPHRYVADENQDSQHNPSRQVSGEPRTRGQNLAEMLKT